MTEPQSQSSSLVDRVAAVLTLFRDADQLGVTDVHRATGLDKSVVHRILRGLAKHDFLEQDADTRRYGVGLRLWELGRRYTHGTTLAELAVPLLRELVDEFHVTGYVGSLDGLEVVYLALVDSPGPIRIHVEVGTRVPVHTTALGKAMLACLPDADLDARIKKLGKLTGPTPSSITSPEKLRAEIEEVRGTGVAANHGEFTEGVAALGAAVRGSGGKPVAAVSVAFPMLGEQEQLWTVLPDRVLSVARQAQTRLKSAAS